MRSLTVLYDQRCSLCQWATQWLAGQEQLLDIVFVPAASAEARARFPRLDHETTLTDITVVSDTGDIYRNEKAWVMVLWCTAKYRGAAERLSSPKLMPMTKRFVKTVSKYRPLDSECEGDVCAS